MYMRIILRTGIFSFTVQICECLYLSNYAWNIVDICTCQLNYSCYGEKDTRQLFKLHQLHSILASLQFEHSVQCIHNICMFVCFSNPFTK